MLSRRRFKIELHREIKDRFAVASYKDICRQDLQQALRCIDSWIPRKYLE
ncbi:ORF6C domain-containing protein [Lysinibacillus xylanilyticus]